MPPNQTEVIERTEVETSSCETLSAVDDTHPYITFTATVSVAEQSLLVSTEGDALPHDGSTDPAVISASENTTCDCCQAVQFNMGAMRQGVTVVQNMPKIDRIVEGQKNIRSASFDVKWHLKPVDQQATYHNEWGIKTPSPFMQAIGFHYQTDAYEESVKDMFTMTVYHMPGANDVDTNGKPYKKQVFRDIASGYFDIANLLTSGSVIQCMHSSTGFPVTINISNVRTNGYDWKQAEPSALRYAHILASISKFQQNLVADCIDNAFMKGNLKMGDSMGRKVESTATVNSKPDTIRSFCEETVNDALVAHELPSAYMLTNMLAAAELEALSLHELATTNDYENLCRFEFRILGKPRILE